MTKLTRTLLAGAAALGLAFTSIVWTAPASAAVIDTQPTSAIVAPPAPASPLGADEIAGLLFMRHWGPTRLPASSSCERRRRWPATST